MAQRPTADFSIDANITSGTDLAGILNRFQDAIDSGNSGASRPAYLDAGGLWVREGDPMRLYLYDGTTDRELYNTTDGLVGASQWKDNGDDIYYSDGNVGIGTSDPDVDLHIYKSNPIIKMEHVGNNSSRFYFESTTDGAWGCIQASNESGNRRLLFAPNNGTGDARYGGLTLHTDKAEIGGEFATNYGLNVHGKVGIGMNPLRSTAKEQLAEWKSLFDARLKAEPKADKKAVTLEITDDAFEVLPTEDKLAEWMETRGAGDKLQVAGNASFSGNVDVAPGVGAAGQAGVTVGSRAYFGYDGSRSAAIMSDNNNNKSLVFDTNGQQRLKIASDTGDATFSGNVAVGGNVDCGNLYATGVVGSSVYPIASGYFSGTVNAASLKVAPLDNGTNQPTMVIERVYDDIIGTKPVIYSPVFQGCGLKFQSGNSPAIYPTNEYGTPQSNGLDFGSNAIRFNQGHFSSVYSGGRPVSTTRDLIETLSTLRNATKDETTLEGLRDAIGDAVGGLVEKFEAIQAEAEKAHEEAQKAATMDIEE